MIDSSIFSDPGGMRTLCNQTCLDTSAAISDIISEVLTRIRKKINQVRSNSILVSERERSRRGRERERCWQNNHGPALHTSLFADQPNALTMIYWLVFVVHVTPLFRKEIVSTSVTASFPALRTTFHLFILRSSSCFLAVQSRTRTDGVFFLVLR